MLIARDVNGYPLQGYDLVPERLKSTPKDTLSELVKLLQEANKREDVLKLEVEHWHQAYLSLHQEYSTFKSVKLCGRCQTIRDTTPPGDTITLCTDCSRDKDTIASLTLKLEKRETELSYWQDCYETLRHQYFENDRRSNAGAHERI